MCWKLENIKMYVLRRKQRHLSPDPRTVRLAHSTQQLFVLSAEAVHGLVATQLVQDLPPEHTFSAFKETWQNEEGA